MNEEEPEENTEFDFSIYEDDEEKQEASVESLKDLEAPQISGLRSRFSLGQSRLQQLAEIGTEISKYSIKVRTLTQDTSDLRKFLALLEEQWEIVRFIYGKKVNEEMLFRKKKCRFLVKKYQEGQIPEKVHNNLLKFQSDLYKLMQFSNLGLETERTNRNIYSKAKRGIVQ